MKLCNAVTSIISLLLVVGVSAEAKGQGFKKKMNAIEKKFQQIHLTKIHEALKAKNMENADEKTKKLMNEANPFPKSLELTAEEEKSLIPREKFLKSTVEYQYATDLTSPPSGIDGLGFAANWMVHTPCGQVEFQRHTGHYWWEYDETNDDDMHTVVQIGPWNGCFPYFGGHGDNLCASGTEDCDYWGSVYVPAKEGKYPGPAWFGGQENLNYVGNACTDANADGTTKDMVVEGAGGNGVGVNFVFWQYMECPSNDDGWSGTYNINFSEELVDMTLADNYEADGRNILVQELFMSPDCDPDTLVLRDEFLTEVCINGYNLQAVYSFWDWDHNPAHDWHWQGNWILHNDGTYDHYNMNNDDFACETQLSGSGDYDDDWGVWTSKDLFSPNSELDLCEHNGYVFSYKFTTKYEVQNSNGIDLADLSDGEKIALAAVVIGGMLGSVYIVLQILAFLGLGTKGKYATAPVHETELVSA